MFCLVLQFTALSCLLRWTVTRMRQQSGIFPFGTSGMWKKGGILISAQIQMGGLWRLYTGSWLKSSGSIHWVPETVHCEAPALRDGKMTISKASRQSDGPRPCGSRNETPARSPWFLSSLRQQRGNEQIPLSRQSTCPARQQWLRGWLHCLLLIIDEHYYAYIWGHGIYWYLNTFLLPN